MIFYLMRACRSGERRESYGTKTEPRKYTTPSKTTSLFLCINFTSHKMDIFNI